MTVHPNWDLTATRLVADIPYFNIQLKLEGLTPAVITYGSIIAYILCIFVIFPMLKPKTKAAIQSFSLFHNAALCIYSTFACGATLYYIYTTGELFNFNAYLCTPVPAWLRFLSITFTVSKIWEWLDTALHLWNGKSIPQIDFLHLYHHATTFCLFMHVMNLPGTEKSGMLLNGFVHSIMYYHFAFRLPRFMRPLITASQIVQLAAVTWFWGEIPSRCPAYAGYPNQHPWEFAVPYLCVPVYLLFFIKFFYDKYCSKKASKNEATSTPSSTTDPASSASGSIQHIKSESKPARKSQKAD